MEHGRRPSPLGAGLRSVLIPGWGQIVTNRDLLGRSLVLVTGLIGCAALAAFLFIGPIEIALWLTDPTVLLGLVIVNLAFAGIRIVSANLAWWDGGGRNWLLPIVLTFVVAGPHVVIGWLGLETRESLLTVFAPTVAVAAAPTTTTTTSTTTTMPLSPIVSVPGQGDDELGAIAKAPPWQPFGIERLNVLLLGGDAGPGRGGLRTDTMMVASIDPISGDAALFGIPRNYGGITFTNGEPIPVRRLNHVYAWGVSHPDVFDGPDPGVSAVTNAIEQISGLEVDYYVLVDLTGFADLVNAFGGVTIDVESPIAGPLYDIETGGYEMIDFSPGVQHMDGGSALAYARSRHTTSDYSRMARQRCILTSMVAQSNPLALLSNLGGILEAISDNVRTDMPVDMVPELFRLLLRVSSNDIRVLGFDSSWGAGVTSDGHTIPDVERIRDAVRELIDDTNSEGTVFQTAPEACGRT